MICHSLISVYEPDVLWLDPGTGDPVEPRPQRTVVWPFIMRLKQHMSNIPHGPRMYYLSQESDDIIMGSSFSNMFCLSATNKAWKDAHTVTMNDHWQFIYLSYTVWRYLGSCKTSWSSTCTTKRYERQPGALTQMWTIVEKFIQRIGVFPPRWSSYQMWQRHETDSIWLKHRGWISIWSPIAEENLLKFKTDLDDLVTSLHFAADHNCLLCPCHSSTFILTFLFVSKSCLTLLGV